MKSAKERINIIKYNLDENDRLYKSGERTRELYNKCLKDGKKRIAEIKEESK